MNTHSNKSIELAVTGGPQTGASLLLEEHTTYRIGSNPSGGYDVLLRSSKDEFALVLDTTPGNYSVLVELGSIAVAGRELAQGEKAPIKAGVSVTAASVGFQLAFEAAAETEKVSPAQTPTQTPAHSTVLPATADNSKRSSGLALFTAGLLLTGGSAAALYTQQPTIPTSEAIFPTLADALSLVALPKLDIIELENNRVKIVGQLKNQLEQDTLKELIAGRPEVIHLATKTEKQVTDEVKEYYRINGIPATVTRTTEGLVKVATKEPNIALLARIESKLEATVPLVGQLVKENNPPKPKKKSKSKADIAKQVLMVMGGENPYLMTRNGGRYFVGSVLPDGRSIAKIDQNNVTLIKGEEEFLLAF